MFCVEKIIVWWEKTKVCFYNIFVVLKENIYQEKYVFVKTIFDLKKDKKTEFKFYENIFQIFCLKVLQ